MKSKVISNKRNIFGIIKETVFGSMADFFKELGSKEPDEMQEEAVTPDVKAGVAKVEATTLDDNKDYIVGAKTKYRDINYYCLMNKEKIDDVIICADDEKEKGAARTRGAR